MIPKTTCISNTVWHIAITYIFVFFPGSMNIWLMPLLIVVILLMVVLLLLLLAAFIRKNR